MWDPYGSSASFQTIVSAINQNLSHDHCKLDNKLILPYSRHILESTLEVTRELIPETAD